MKNFSYSTLLVLAFALIFSSFKNEPKLKSVTGKITSVSGEDLAGAQIKKNSGCGSIANFNGEFTITFENASTDSVTIHHIGYKPLTKKASSLYNNCVLTLEEL